MTVCICGTVIEAEAAACPRCGSPLQGGRGSEAQGRVSYGTTSSADQCPDCGADAVIPRDGCAVCTVCGWVACGG